MMDIGTARAILSDLPVGGCLACGQEHARRDTVIEAIVCRIRFVANDEGHDLPDQVIEAMARLVFLLEVMPC